MEIGELISLLSRWFHVLTATILVGGTLFLRFTIVPARRLGELNDESFEFVRKRWAKLVMIAILLSLVSGLYNAAIKSIGFKLDPVYLSLMGLKIVVGMFVYFMISALSGRSKMAQRFRESETKWYNITSAAVILLVLAAGYMKMSEQQVKPKDETEQTAVKLQSVHRHFEQGLA